MIDDIDKATDLVEMLTKELPLFAYPTKNLRNSMLNSNNIKLKPKSLLEIKEVLYMGDEGGIGCVIPFKNATELLLISLTHLRIIEKQPLVKEIKEYQSSRNQSLLKKDAQDLYSGKKKQTVSYRTW
jgi:hypothetical protein